MRTFISSSSDFSFDFNLADFLEVVDVTLLSSSSSDLPLLREAFDVALFSWFLRSILVNWCSNLELSYSQSF